MALQAAANATAYLRMEAICDYGMDVKPSLKHTLNQLAIGLLRHCSREAFTVFLSSNDHEYDVLTKRLWVSGAADYEYGSWLQR